MNAEHWYKGESRSRADSGGDGTGLETPDAFAPGFIRRSRRNVLIMTIVTAAAIIAGSLIKIDVFATAAGQISPDIYTKSIDSPRTGYVRKLFVDNGQTVRVGQPILGFDCGPEQAQRDAAQSQLADLQEALDAQSLLGRNIVPGFRGGASGTASDRPRNEAALRTSLFESSRTSASQAVLRAQAKVAGAQARLAAVRADRQLKQSSWERMKALNARGFATSAALDQRAAELQQSASAVDLARADVAEAEEAVRQLRSDAASATLEGQSSALLAVSTTRAKLLQLRTEAAKLETELKNCTVNAPATGQLFWLNSLAPGTWVRAADPLSKVVPQNQPMIVQAALQGQDIPFVHVGQRAMVKLASLPFVRYGTLTGHVRFVSPDSITDEVGKSTYRIEIEMTSIPPEARRALPSLISGMDAEVNIVTDRRRLIGYLFEPIIVAINNSFHER